MKTKVQRAYIGSERTLVDSQGRVFLDGMWMTGNFPVVRVPGSTYDRWCDVPFAWVGACPYFR